ncbi:hypothetical protein APSETT444_005467 [Aspergillus pseudonomiae]
MPQYGALGATFMIARIIQVCCLIAIIGLTANFIAEIVNSDLTPPNFLLLIAVIVVAVIIGKPLSYLQCDKIAEVTDKISSAYTFATKLSSYLSHLNGKLQYVTLIGASKGVCLEAKSIWGLSIALWYVLFPPVSFL